MRTFVALGCIRMHWMQPRLLISDGFLGDFGHVRLQSADTKEESKESNYLLR